MGHLMDKTAALAASSSANGTVCRQLCRGPEPVPRTSPVALYTANPQPQRPKRGSLLWAPSETHLCPLLLSEGALMAE